MSKYILPIFIVLVFIIGLIKKVPLYDNFVEGIKDALKLVISVFPYVCTIFISMELFRISGLSELVSKAIAPIFKLCGIPSELCELIILRPLSGNGSIAMLEQLYATYGADAYISRCASVIVGCSETTFYISAVYFSTTKVKKLRYAIPVSIIACFFGAIFSCIICRFI